MTRKDKMNLANGVAWITAVFILVISVMLIANYLHLKLVDPLESPALQSLVERLRQNPNDEVLKNDIRALDLMIRKAYFTSQWQIRTGAYLLVLGILVLILAVRYQKSMRPGLEELHGIEKNTFLDKQLARKWMVYVGSGLFLFALLSGFFSENILDKFESQSLDGNNNSPGVEVVDVKQVEPETETVANIMGEERLADPQETQLPKEETAEPEATVTGNTEVKTASAPVKVAVPLPTKEQIQKNYPFFRGPEGTGISYKTNVPEKWDMVSGENIRWKVKVSKPGYNSPIIWNDKLFVSGADTEERMVFCYDKNTGDLLWEVKADQIPGSPVKMPNVTEDTGLAAPTMATNGLAVFALFGTGDLIALDMNGKRLWAKNLGVPDNHYGHSSSLIIYRDKLIIQYDTNRGAKVMALDITDGSPKWETIRDVRISWASPALVRVENHDELILTGEPLVAGYDPETGKELWKVDCMMGEVGPSVGYADGIVYAANEYATLAAIKPGSQAEILWEASEYLPEVASPVAANGLLIVATSYGVVACYDAGDGTKYWEHEYGDGIYASPVYADGKVYVLDMAGNMHVLKMTREFQLVAESQMGEKSVCSPVFADGRMYLRGFEYLYCIGK